MHYVGYARKAQWTPRIWVEERRMENGCVLGIFPHCKPSFVLFCITSSVPALLATLYFLMPHNYIRIMLLRSRMRGYKTADGFEIQAEAPEM
jgi:hypothetical protein